MNCFKQIGYLISRYPAYSHTFIQREVEGLREKGLTIFTASINPTDIPEDSLSPTNREETRQTFYVKNQGVLKALGIFACHFIKNPIKLFKGLFFSLSLAKYDLKRMIFHVFYFVEAVLIYNWMKTNKLNHLHVHFANPASTVAMIASKIFPITFSMTIHGPDEFYDVTSNFLKEKIERAKFIFCISYYTQSQVMRLVNPNFWGKLQVCYLGIDPNKYNPRDKQTPLLSGRPIQILSVGRLSPNKGQRILLEAFKALKQEGKNIQLTLVGDGPDRKELEQWVVKNDLDNVVIFKGALEANLVIDFFKTSDLFALTSFAEGLPVALMEAMAFEIPCITTAINGIPEMIINEKNGLLVPASDINQTIIAVRKAVDDGAYRKTLGQEARETIVDKFNLSKNIERLSQLFTQNLVEQKDLCQKQ